MRWRHWQVAVTLLAAGPVSWAQVERIPRKEAFFPPEVARVEARAMPLGRAQRARAVETRLEILSRQESEQINLRATPPRIGVHRDLAPALLESGRWEDLRDGRRVWRLAVRSPGSAALRLNFVDFSVGSGRVWVYPADRDDPSDGPYSGTGVYDNGIFWTATISGESAVVEYEPGEDQPAEGVPPFNLSRIAHRVYEPGQAGAATPILRSLGPRQLETTVGPLAQNLPKEDPAAACNLDVSCYPEWAEAARMVGNIVFELEEGEASCSGTLVATRNNSLKPYFLTANHCVGSESVARTVETFWQFQTSQCRGARPTTRGSARSQVGATLLSSAGISHGDFTLIRLRDLPAGVAYSGWDVGEPGLGSLFVGIHHPLGSHKRISFGRRVSDSGVNVEGLNAPADMFYQTVFYDGVTEPGSSGSPIFTSPGVLVGVLSYGLVADDICSLRQPRDGYGRFSVAYPVLRDYLEDLPFTEVTPSPASLTFQVRNGAFVGAASQTVSVNTQSATAVRFLWRLDAAWLRATASGDTTSSGNAARLTVTVDPSAFKTAGSYNSVISVANSASPPQFINVRVDVALDRSRVNASVSPNPIFEQEPDSTGARWFFQIRLQEEAGVATGLDTFKVNGVDYSSQIQSLFGATRIAANGSIQANLQAANLSVPTEQYFEVGGVDEGSGQRWYRTISASFL
ncbi:MAG: trypsin-like peptidase domain-containing protein, partial [Bryobacteraceae bacterium]